MAKKIGLISGCFDILHLGHIRLFQFAKQNCDYLIIALENDETIRLTKGEGRPIHDLKTRFEILSEIKRIDEIVALTEKINYKADQKKSAEVYQNMLQKIMPDIVFSTAGADPFRPQKQKIAADLGIKFLQYKNNTPNSSSKLIEKLGL